MAMRTKEQDKEELEFFKKSDITVALKAFGYTYHKAKYDSEKKGTNTASWKKGGVSLKVFSSKVSGDQMWKIHSGASPDTQYGRQSGTIIHIASAEAGSLGLARVKLRAIYGDPCASLGSSTSSPAPSSSHSPSTPPERKSFGDVARELNDEAYRWMGETEVPVYLRERGLADLDPMFAGSFWVAKKEHDGSPNVIFPYYAENPETGKMVIGCYERKNRTFKGVVKDAPSSGFWKCGPVGGRVSWYIAENPINAMSWHKIQRDAGMPLDGINYAGLRSGGNDALVSYIKHLCAIGQAPLEIVFLADNDPTGWGYAADVGNKLKEVAKEHGILVRMELAPNGHNDWNDHLMEEMGLSRQPAPTPEPEPEVSYKLEDLDDSIPF